MKLTKIRHRNAVATQTRIPLARQEIGAIVPIELEIAATMARREGRPSRRSATGRKNRPASFRMTPWENGGTQDPPLRESNAQGWGTLRVFFEYIVPLRKRNRLRLFSFAS